MRLDFVAHITMTRNAGFLLEIMRHARIFSTRWTIPLGILLDGDIARFSTDLSSRSYNSWEDLFDLLDTVERETRTSVIDASKRLPLDSISRVFPSYSFENSFELL